ncbi:FAD-dependent tricarballylate dehydrogenase TcuA [Oceanobacillus saliphilus]|uniref:FAD-dependent tricarballylate dehydrogenase TcuA n=1 Tax=Oceanobacillus saliphilus TaxID=2925834 RepID=UPI00201E01BD
MDNNVYDVIVVGSGNAALCAAVSAREEGLNVLVVEKGPKEKRGGNSFFTDGAIRCAYNNLDEMRKVLPEVTDEQAEKIEMPVYEVSDFHEDLMRVTKGKSEPSLANKLSEDSFETIKWMYKQGVRFDLNENQYFDQGGKLVFWGGLPLKTHRKGMGLIESLFNRLDELNVETLYETRAIGVQQENGKIVGLNVENKDASNSLIPAKAVILASGGFEASKAKRMKYIGEEWEKAVVRGSEYNTGDGIEIALEAGGKKYGEWDGCHAHTTDYNAPRVGDYSKPGDIYKKSSYPLGLIVNKNGERFVDEGADFRNYTYAKYGKETLKQPDQKAFQLYDSQVRSLLRKEYDLKEATCIKADTLEELAEKMGVEQPVFLETIERYNQAVQEGDYNPSIKDGKQTVGIEPSKSNWALTFDQAPFYAYPVTCGITFTFGAVRVNDLSEVLDEQEQPIPGLFAAGEMVGGLFYHNYPGGSGLMSGAVFGKQAGKTAANYLSALKEKAK